MKNLTLPTYSGHPDDWTDEEWAHYMSVKRQIAEQERKAAMPTKPYRVIQTGTTTDLWGKVTVAVTGTKDYRWKWVARLSAWYHKGDSILGVTKYQTKVVYIGTLEN